MTPSTQAFVGLLVATITAFVLAGLDAFWAPVVLHRMVFGLWFDEGLIGASLVALGVHWTGVGNLPMLTERRPGNAGSNGNGRSPDLGSRTRPGNGH